MSTRLYFIKNILLLIIVSEFSLMINYSFAQVIFEDNFNNHIDWSPTQDHTIEYWEQSQPDGAIPPPNGYFGYRSSRSHFANYGHNTLNIDNTNFRGDSGKAFTFWSESDASWWASDGLLNITLPDPKGYPELYIRFYIKFQSGWQWSTENSPMQKFFRISHYHGGNPSLMKANQHPMHLFLLAKFGGGDADISANLGARYEVSYYPDSAIPSHKGTEIVYFGNGNFEGTGTDFWDPGMMGDGNWHCWEFYVKINSMVGIPDGIVRFWQDGVLIGEVTDLAWSDVGAQENPRRLWNFVQLGGNNTNHYDADEEESEQWYAIDDFVVSTQYINLDYVIGSPWINKVSPDTLIDGKKNIKIEGINFGSSADILSSALEIINSETYENATQFVQQQITSISDSTITFDAQLNNLSSTNGLFYIFFTSKGGNRSPKGFPIYLPDTITNVNESLSDLPETFQLFQNYPNPFNPSTVISYNIAKQSKVFLTVYNVRGQRVKILVDEISMQSGYKQVEWNGRDDQGHLVPSGLYFYKLETGAVVLNRKMLLLK